MTKKWSYWKLQTILLTGLVLILCCSCLVKAAEEAVFEGELRSYVDAVFGVEDVDLLPGVRIERMEVDAWNGTATPAVAGRGREVHSVQDYVKERLGEFVRTHSLSVNVQQTGRFLSSAVLIGAQLIKSVLIAMFLPSILGGLGKIVGKGLSTFSGISAASTGLNQNHNHDQMEEFEFKDTDPYGNEQGIMGNDFQAQGEASNQLDNVDLETSTSSANSRFGLINQRISFVQPASDNYYMRRPPPRKTDYKVFHKIPTSSLLLTGYDPFYSPLLSRLDAIFQQLGLGNAKSAETERCRERLVCMMYANPAKYAPYSNLVSAQLSRELNELKKPSSDNPEILRFFKYMKAAKDGQDGEECLAHGGCPSLNSHQTSPAMLTTFNDINKLVLARKFV